MIVYDEGKSQGVKTISTKISREDFSRLQYFCKINGETINALLKKAILSELDINKPARIAGNSIFEYSKSKDNFVWKVVFDDNSISIIDENLPVGTIEQLDKSISKVIEERKRFIKKTKENSVSIPNKLMRMKK